MATTAKKPTKKAAPKKPAVRSSGPDMMNWQWQNILACLGHITFHAQDDSCPCNQVHMGDDGKYHAEYCLGKHLIDTWSLCLETALMAPEHRDLLDTMAVEANEFLEKAKTIYCKGGVWPDLAKWARECRKKIEPIFYACKVKPAPAPIPAVDTPPAAAADPEIIEVVLPPPAPIFDIEIVPEVEVIPAPAPPAEREFVKLAGHHNLWSRKGKKYRLFATGVTPNGSWLINPKMVELLDIDIATGKDVYGKSIIFSNATGTMPAEYEFIRYSADTTPAPAPGLVAEVCAGLQEGKDTHVHFLGVPPDPKTGDHAWHRKWVDLYSKAQTVVGCGGR